MKIKIIILFISLTITACFHDQFEYNQDLHIKDAEDKIKKVMESYSEQSSLVNTVEGILKHHQTALDDFNEIKKSSSKYKDEQKLATIISLYDYVFTYLIYEQVELIESTQVILNKNIQILEELKKPTYFQQHQQLLKEMLFRIDENRILISQHHEKVRTMFVSSDLDDSERTRLWPLFNDLTIKHSSSLTLLIHPIQTRVESEIELSTFFHQHRDGYVVTKQKGLEFLSYEMLDAYNNKLQEMNKKYNQARVINRLANP